MKSLLYAAVFVTATIGFSSCSNDEPSIHDTSLEEEFDVIDELAELQDALVKLDENGNVKERVFGVVLDESTPDVVWAGIENFDEAREYFSTLFSDTTAISTDGMKATFSTRQGSATLSKESGNGGLVAKVIFDIEGLKHISQINFILNSAWPENDNMKSIYKYGVVYMLSGFTGTRFSNDEPLSPFVCVREYKNGIPALLVGITSSKHEMCGCGTCKRALGNSPGPGKAQEISKILNGNWAFFKTAFTIDGTELLAENEKYWIDKRLAIPMNPYRYTINLKTARLEKHSGWYNNNYRVVFCLTAGGKM